MYTNFNSVWTFSYSQIWAKNVEILMYHQIKHALRGGEQIWGGEYNLFVLKYDVVSNFFESIIRYSYIVFANPVVSFQVPKQTSIGIIKSDKIWRRFYSVGSFVF